ncbi:MAG: hypothetical protein M3Q37_02670 [Gemmatimonadota bacterium]|nr:hypothetical protein [Gemmatimonadota bacterium]
MEAVITLIRRWCIIPVLLAVVAGCAGEPPVSPADSVSDPSLGQYQDDDDEENGSSDGDVGDDDDLKFLKPADDAPPLAATQVSFYAVRGQEREARIMYRPKPGAADSSEFVRFVVGAGSLVERPDGSPIAMGDSLQITLTVVDTVRLIVDFQPDGLRFAAGSLARLRFSYGETDDDLDDDGDADAADEAIETTFAIWRQETAGAPYSRIPSTVDTVAEQVAADIDGFTRYAVAY